MTQSARRQPTTRLLPEGLVEVLAFERPVERVGEVSLVAEPEAIVAGNESLFQQPVQVLIDRVSEPGDVEDFGRERKGEKVGRRETILAQECGRRGATRDENEDVD